VAAYGKVDFLRIGPLMEDNRADRLLFWPDRRGIGLKQVQAILAEEDPAATDLAGLQAKSVAVQGLGALEFVLFGTGAESLTSIEGSFRCAYGQTIAGNIAGMAKEMVAGWYVPGGYQRSMALAIILPSLILGAFVGFAMYKVAKARFAPPASGRLVGEEAEALDRLDREGYVIFQGEYWKAEAEEPVEKGERVVILAKEGERLKVRRA
jgi:membrane protein implicated in regulation of membrane protease activity